jgi:hypothetical protein
MDHIIKNAENISLDENDLRKICMPYNVKIIYYSELNKYDDINTLFKESDNIIILYRTEGNYGHWVALLNYGDYIEFFDSYGMQPDYELQYAQESMRSTKGQDEPHLTYLLNNAKNRYKKKIVYNSVRLQQFHQYINTCGRHVALRIKFRHIELNDYQKLLLSSKLNPDMNATYLTYLLVDKDLNTII